MSEINSLERIPKPIEDKRSRAIKFKDYAISHGFAVSDSTIRDINDADYAIQRLDYQASHQPIEATDYTIQQGEAGDAQKLDAAQLSTRLDKAIKELVALTGPLELDGEGNVIRRIPRIAFLTSDYSLLVYSTLAILGAILSIFRYQTSNQHEWLFVLAVCMGILGSLVYILFNLTGHLSDQAFITSNPIQRIVRMFLGGILGFVFYFSLAQPAFRDALDVAAQNDTSGVNPLLFLPFLAGFSTRLVFGILYQAVNATLSIFGLEDLDSQETRDEMSNQAEE